ncbi:MAG: LysR family transcriptional regulator [Novosphingobium sp.]
MAFNGSDSAASGMRPTAALAGQTGALQLHQLRAIDALYRDRSVTLAAARLCVTPSAISHSLRRLREMLGDDLFRRGRHGMQPTERAHTIIPRIREALGLLDSAFDGGFDPAVAGREFRISGLLSMRMLLAPVLAKKVEESKRSGLLIDFRQINDSFADDLESGHIDLAITTLSQPHPWMRSQVLHHEAMAFVIRAGHPRGNGPLSLVELANMTHVNLRGTDFYRRAQGQRGDGSLESMEAVGLGVALAQHRLEAKVGIVVPDTLSALEVVKHTDLISLCPRRVAELHGGDEICVLDVPYPAYPSPMRMIWNVRQDRDAGLHWLREIIVAACRNL